MNLTADQLAFIVLSCGVLLFVLMLLGAAIVFVLFATGIITTGVSIFSNAIGVRKQWDENWPVLAKRAGLRYRPGDLFNFPSVIGNYRGRPLRLNFSNHSRHARRMIVEILVQNPAGWSLYLQPRDILDPLGKAIGLRDIEIGDPAFGKKFRIGSTPPDAAARMLSNDALREVLLTAPVWQFALEGNRLYYAVRQLEVEIDPLLTLFDRLSTVADEIERAQGVETQEAAAASEPRQPVFASDTVQSKVDDDPFAGRGLFLSTSWLRSIDPMNKARRVGCLGIIALAIMMWTTICLAVAAYHLFFGTP